MTFNFNYKDDNESCLRRRVDAKYSTEKGEVDEIRTRNILVTRAFVSCEKTNSSKNLNR